jgi:hypothetical protein
MHAFGGGRFLTGTEHGETPEDAISTPHPKNPAKLPSATPMWRHMMLVASRRVVCALPRHPVLAARATLSTGAPPLRASGVICLYTEARSSVPGTLFVFRAGRKNINMYRGNALGRMSSRPTRPEGPRGAPESAGWAISYRDWGKVRPPGWPKDAISTPERPNRPDGRFLTRTAER